MGFGQPMLDLSNSFNDIAPDQWHPISTTEDLQPERAISRHHQHRRIRRTAHGNIHRRGDCKTAQVNSGDSCGSLATTCGITAEQFTQYNSNPDLCSTLLPGQRVCCSEGSLPDLSPKQQADGTCFTYTVATDDTCSALAGANSITTEDIEAWNSQTWQFMSCDKLQIGQVICLSAGSAPMPAALPNAVCGPQVNDTKRPDDMSAPGALAALNPCPLNACCNRWGQCGTTSEFCTNSSSTTGASVTVAASENGCIQNCGTDIVQSDPPPSQFAIGYYEAFSVERPCLTMQASEIPTSAFTHLHFAFANISEDFNVEIGGSTAAQFDVFRSIAGPKRVVSFGGWSFSTSADSYPIFRQVVTDENRQTFIANLVRFVKDKQLDGLDFDWEYPGASDMPGIPPGDPKDGERYLGFLRDLRAALPSEVSLSIAAPASYWYLKGFAIAEMSKVVDYIVYMTYDLHGQWDYGNKYSISGCPAGDCLRSGVNLTETTNALSMITKAGVPSNKIVVGVTSYGRAFKMTDGGCTGAMCTFTGPESGALPGDCTQARGYIANAEINDILASDATAKTFYDTDSDSDIMTYGTDQWVSYMSDTTKESRRSFYLGMNFLGTVDWAVDLAVFAADAEAAGEKLPDCNNADAYHTIDDILNDKNIPGACMDMYTLSAMATTMSDSLENFTDIMSDGYTHKYDAYAKQVRQVAPLQWDSFWHADVNNHFTCEYAVPKSGGKSYTNTSGGCPPNNVPKEFEGRAYNIYFAVNDEKAFCDKIQDDYGLDCSWIEYTSIRTSPCLNNNDCAAWGNLYSPGVKPDFEVPDPGKLISQSLGNYTSLSQWLTDSALDSQVYLFPGFEADAIDAATTAVFSTQAAVTNMQVVADAGEKAEAEERKAIILAFLSALLLIIPGVGEAANAVLDVAMIARIATLIGETGSVALTLYDVAMDPESAPMAIIGGLLGGAIGRDESLWAKAAVTRRTMSDDVVKSLGKEVSANMGKVQGLTKRCSR